MTDIILKTFLFLFGLCPIPALLVWVWWENDWREEES